MSTESQSNNKRIAKNTLMLYFRMFIMMAIGLFTSRVILQTLGVEDYGIYNVVGGIVAMMGILNGSMASSIQRYLSFELGKRDAEQLKKTFSVCFFIYIFMSIVFVILAETIGLWFLNNKLVIPDDRMYAANWVYQFTIISVVNQLLVNPYNASIIAHERMNIYAYISILEAALKLFIVYLLLIIPLDRLITYGFLYLVLSLSITMIYRIYCIRKFEECHIHWYNEKHLYKQLLSYSGWNLFGAAAGVVKGQGLNILLNMFFNPSVNAARGIAYQINTQISHFFSNFYTAVRPQIIKYYAQGDMGNMLNLVFRSSKFSYYLILLISLPIIIETPFIVNIWLGQLPEHVVIFTRLIIAITAIDAMANPLMTTAHATGRIAFYQASVGTMTIMIIPVSYIFLKNGFSPDVVFIISLITSVICLFMRLGIVKWLVDFPVWIYIKDVFGSAMLVTITSSILPIYLHISMMESWGTVMANCSLCVICTIVSVYSFGINKHERELVINAIKSKFNR